MFVVVETPILLLSMPCPFTTTDTPWRVKATGAPLQLGITLCGQDIIKSMYTLGSPCRQGFVFVDAWCASIGQSG